MTGIGFIMRRYSDIYHIPVGRVFDRSVDLAASSARRIHSRCVFLVTLLFRAEVTPTVVSPI